jgi:hypothetical protein
MMGSARAIADVLASLEQVALAQDDEPAARRFADERQRWLTPAKQNGHSRSSP